MTTRKASTTPKHRRSSGSVRQLPSGRWQARYKIGEETLKAPDTYRTKTEATDWLATTRARVVRGDRADTKRGDVSFAEYAERWYQRRVNAGSKPLAPTTAAKYRRLIDGYLFPAFGDSSLAKIGTEEIEIWYNGIAKHHQSTAADAYRLLATIYNAAIVDKVVVTESPCRIEGASRARAAERPTATPLEVQAAVDATPEQYRLAVLLAAWCQLRRGEILGLQRGDIDLDEGSVTIRRARLVTSAGTAHEGPPKSDAGRRTVYMPPQVLEAMTTHLDRFTSPSSTAWLFERDGKPLHILYLERVWRHAREKAGRTDLHLHDLRHSGLTWAAQQGATTAEIMRQAGHASPVAAIRYQHATDTRAKELAARFGRMVPNGTE